MICKFRQKADIYMDVGRRAVGHDERKDQSIIYRRGRVGRNHTDAIPSGEKVESGQEAEGAV